MNEFFNKRRAKISLDNGNIEFEIYYEDGTLIWTSLPNRDRSEKENLIFEKLNDSLYNISWVESTGITVTHIINLDENKVWAIWSWDDAFTYGGRKMELHMGSFYFLNETNEHLNEPLTNIQIVTTFWEEFFNKHDTNAVDKYLDSSYIQHNPYVADGVDEFKKFFIPAFRNELKEFSAEIKHIASSENLVFLHNHQRKNSSDLGSAALDIFRLKNGKIVEHWDVIQAIPEKSANDNTMF